MRLPVVMKSTMVAWSVLPMPATLPERRTKVRQGTEIERSRFARTSSLSKADAIRLPDTGQHIDLWPSGANFKRNNDRQQLAGSASSSTHPIDPLLPVEFLQSCRSLVDWRLCADYTSTQCTYYDTELLVGDDPASIAAAMRYSYGAPTSRGMGRSRASSPAVLPVENTITPP